MPIPEGAKLTVTLQMLARFCHALRGHLRQYLLEEFPLFILLEKAVIYESFKQKAQD